MSIFEAQIIAYCFEQLRELDQLDLDLKQRATRRKSRNRFVIPGLLNIVAKKSKSQYQRGPGKSWRRCQLQL
jgi:hypothetical protein